VQISLATETNTGEKTMDFYSTPVDPSGYMRVAHDRDGQTWRWGIDSPDGLYMEFSSRRAAEKRIREIVREMKRREAD
jgi:hypothetical protein